MKAQDARAGNFQSEP